MDTTVVTSLHEKGLGNVLGTSSAMRAMFDLIQRGAPTEATVLLLGESGVGKELVARRDPSTQRARATDPSSRSTARRFRRL